MDQTVITTWTEAETDKEGISTVNYKLKAQLDF